MSGTWFTSDLHLGHATVAKDRGFATVEEHDYAIMQTLRQVPAGDQLWILGDLSIGSNAAELLALSMLNDLRMEGRELHLIAGNHDTCHPVGNRNSHRAQDRFLEVFASVQLFARRRIEGRTVLLSHYPYSGDHTEFDRDVEFRLQDRGAYLLHGHTHSSDVFSGLSSPQTIRKIGRRPELPGRQIHIGWDAHRSVVPIEEIARYIEAVES
ncbi:metallophosphoesterase [Rhodococcus erythropolis]|uniref:metallophosphoesterase n=1 Tax=Rhodococcus erythropolis TaxID=1833 RepID=UPI00404352D3